MSRPIIKKKERGRLRTKESKKNENEPESHTKEKRRHVTNKYTLTRAIGQLAGALTKPYRREWMEVKWKGKERERI